MWSKKPSRKVEKKGGSGRIPRKNESSDMRDCLKIRKVDLED